MPSFGQVIPVTGPYIGFAGKISRLGERVTAARQVFTATPTVSKPGVSTPILFGQGVVMLGDSTGGTYQSIADFLNTTIYPGTNTFTAPLFAGVAISEVETTGAYASYLNPGVSLSGSYLPGLIAEVLERGSVVVPCLVGVPVAGAAVYVRTALDGNFAAGVVGGFEATANGSSNVALTNAVFRTGVLDANYMTEITLLSRVAA